MFLVEGERRKSIRKAPNTTRNSEMDVLDSLDSLILPTEEEDTRLYSHESFRIRNSIPPLTKL